MTTLRKAHIKCPKCGAGITVRDNGGLTPAQADRVWAAFDRAFEAMDRAFAAMRKAFRA
jgi:hypothetical protein